MMAVAGEKLPCHEGRRPPDGGENEKSGGRGDRNETTTSVRTGFNAFR